MSNQREAQSLLVAEARSLYQRGWMLGTSGNLSLRVDDPVEPWHIAITASGVDKGRLEAEDVLILDHDLTIIGTEQERRPSAEAAIHRAIYRSNPDIKSILHVHTVATTMASTLANDAPNSTLDITGFEMIKGFDLWDPNATASIPVLQNHHEVSQIAEEVETLLKEAPSVPAFLIRGHGMTAWGKTIAQARKHLEICEFLCTCAWEERHR